MPSITITTQSDRDSSDYEHHSESDREEDLADISGGPNPWGEEALTRTPRRPSPLIGGNTGRQASNPFDAILTSKPGAHDFSKVTNRFGGMDLSQFRPAGSQSDSFTSLSSTISRDNTTGERARNAKLLAEFAQKSRKETLAPEKGSRVRSSKSNPFDYEIRTAEPRAGDQMRLPGIERRYTDEEDSSDGSWAYSADEIDPLESENKTNEYFGGVPTDTGPVRRLTASYDSTTDRKRAAEKEEQMIPAEYVRKPYEKLEEEERSKRAREKEAKHAHIVKDKTGDEYSPRASEKKFMRQRIEEEIIMRETAARAVIKEGEMERRQRPQLVRYINPSEYIDDRW